MQVFELMARYRIRQTIDKFAIFYGCGVWRALCFYIAHAVKERSANDFVLNSSGKLICID